MATVVLRVCDICEAPNANEWELQGPDGRRAVDLCDTHAQPLADIFAKASRPVKKKNETPRGGRGGAGRSRMEVKTLEEIQALKQAK